MFRQDYATLVRTTDPIPRNPEADHSAPSIGGLSSGTGQSQLPRLSPEVAMGDNGTKGACTLCPILWAEGRSGDPLELVPPDHEIWSRLFHEPCSDCQHPPFEPLRSDPLCSACNHLRLPHLVRCMLGSLYDRDPSDSSMPSKLYFQITRGPEELSSVEDCSWCRAIGRALVSNKWRLYGDVKSATSRNQEDRERSNVWLSFENAATKSNQATLVQIVSNFINSRTEWAYMEANLPDQDNSQNGLVFHNSMVEMVDWDFVQSHLKNRYDLGSSVKPLDPIPKGFMLIDVNKGCLTDAPPAPSYAALSYVWGEPQANQGWSTAGTGNISRLRCTGSLLNDAVPATIRDAMEACRLLDIQFLWVDRFCILQDDDSKHSQINRMADIYASAKFTIVATVGPSAAYGLPGMSSRPRVAAQQVVVDDICFQQTFPSETWGFIEEVSPWHKRGWTFQEGVLSHTLVHFTHYGVYIVDRHQKLIHQEGSRLTVRDHVLAMIYWHAVSAYSTRKLSYESDILEAFTGFLNDSFPSAHYFGLPTEHIDEAILWHLSGPGRRRENTPEAFPTWSWASVIGQVDSEYAKPFFHDWPVLRGPLATWAIPKSNHSRGFNIVGRHISRSPGFPAVRWEDDWANICVCLAIAWIKGYFTEKAPPLLTACQTWSDVQDTLFTRWPTYESFWKESRGISDDKDEEYPGFTKDLAAEQIQAALRPGRLVVQTQSSRFFLKRDYGPEEQDFRSCFVIKSMDDRCVGTMELHQIHATVVEETLEKQGFFSAEFLAIAITNYDIEVFDSWWTEFRADATTDQRDFGPHNDLKSGPESIRLPPTLIVMMIRTHENYAERIGIGLVYLKEWILSNPTLKTTILA